jgi:hypothetical protein
VSQILSGGVCSFFSFILEVDSEPSAGHVVDLLIHVHFLRGTRPNKICMPNTNSEPETFLYHGSLKPPNVGTYSWFSVGFGYATL